MDRSRRGRIPNPRQLNDQSGNEEAGSFRVTVMIAALALLVIVGAGIVFLLLPSGTAVPRPGTTLGNDGLDSNTFYDGVFVDEISLGGLTREQAKQQIEAKQTEFVQSAAVTVTKDDKSWPLKVTDTAWKYDTDAMLDQAWQQGRQGTNEERKAAIKQLPGNPVRLKTTLTADPSALEEQVRALAEPYSTEPVNAAFMSYDPAKPDGQRFTFSPDKPGSKVDADALWAAVKQSFADQSFGTVAMQSVPVQADVTLAELQAMKLVTRFSSVIKDHSTARYTNIKIASSAVNGRILMPGEVFSFNDATGPRTANKGYMEAHIINGGVVDNGLAGGTCQVSGTLWNAVARADLEIVERQAHTLKSSYLPMGQDATVDYGHYDLKFKNSKDKPVLIIMYPAVEKGKYKLYGEVYGEPLPAGVTIDLLTQKTDTVPAPDTISYAPSEAVKPGTTETVKPHDGIICVTYKLYMKNGQEIDRKLLHKDYYKEAGTIICYNPADGKPAATPSSSPKSSPTGSASPGSTASPSATVFG